VDNRPDPLLIKHARDAFGDERTVAAEWRALNFTAPPDLARAVGDYDTFLGCLRRLGATPVPLPKATGTGVGLDSIYVRDASVITPHGVILCRMGKPERTGEPAAQQAFFQSIGIPILGAIQPPGTLEGGDVTWLDARTLAVGHGYRTNEAGIRQLRELLGDSIDEFIVVPLPHWRGRGDVFHLMSILSPVDHNLAVVYSPLMPVTFHERLAARGIGLVEVPDAEFDSMGANVLALAPRRVVMVEGNPRTRALLERAGAEVLEYTGREISLKGGGGPTCLTRPIRRQGL
jgi:N-dimethylarginine dimethylaminohydrolase